MTWQDAIIKVLGESATPLHYKEIADKIVNDGLRKKIGATPSATVNAYISASLKQEGEESPYRKIDRGVFTLKENVLVSSNTDIGFKADEADNTEEQYDIVTSFGMFWRRSEIDWTRNPKLLGMQRPEATPVNFNKQIGVYLLYDGREVIYVGRTTERPLGTRLYEHTLDRFSARWDRFSWFGLLPVSSDGELNILPESYDATKLIPALEAILIEALEPRQNRKRGDDLSSVEYIQKTDPSVERKRFKAYIDEKI